MELQPRLDACMLHLYSLSPTSRQQKCQVYAKPEKVGARMRSAGFRRKIEPVQPENRLIVDLPMHTLSHHCPRRKSELVFTIYIHRQENRNYEIQR